MKKILIIVILVLAGVFAWSYFNNETEVEMIQLELVGTWQAVDDLDAVVEYKADGTVVDSYGGEIISEGTWAVKDQTAEGEDMFGTADIFLSVIIGQEVFEYGFYEINEESLVINYLDRGNTLEYTRINQ